MAESTGLSAASAIPIAGNFLGAGKLALKYGDDVVGFAASHVDEAASLGARKGDDVASCAVKSLNSFSPDTIVATSAGAVAISAVDVGDAVQAVDPGTDVVDDHMVTAVHVNEDPAIAYLRIDGETIETTPDHRFLTYHGWAEAEHLQPGDQVRKLDGGFGIVDGYRIEFRPVVMWDLTVSEVHTFAVGGGRFLVHNLGPCDGLARSNHGNSLSTTKPSEGYTLRDIDSDEILKYGETTLGRGRYSTRWLKGQNAYMNFELSGTKLDTHQWQHDMIIQFRIPNGIRPRLNRSDW